MSRLAPFLVFGVTAAVFAPAIGYAWIPTWDDSGMFFRNPMIHTWSWQWMALTTYLGHWMPLSWLLATVNYHLWGLEPAGWHAANVLLHSLNAVLVYLIARRLVASTLGAVFAALVFSVHPLRIESVAWVTELRDVLMGAFYLGAALLWLHGRRRWAFALFILACLSKSLAVSLPVMLLLMDWYRHRADGWRLRDHLRWQLVPFVAVSIAVSAIAFRALILLGNSLPWSTIGLGPRLLHVAYSEVFYAAQTVWPSRLSHLIEYTWAPSWGQPQYPVAVAACLAASVILLLTRRRWPALTAACLGYAIAVFPQSGLFQNGPQLVANRYSYLACLPFALLAGGLLAKLPWTKQDSAYPVGVAPWPLKGVAVGGLVVALLIVTTSYALPMWRDQAHLWRYAASHEPTCTWCHDMAGALAYQRGEFEVYRQHMVTAIAVSDTTYSPKWERHWNLADVLLRMGRRDEAVVAIRTYLAAVPVAYRNTGLDRIHIAAARDTLARLERSP